MYWLNLKCPNGRYILNLEEAADRAVIVKLMELNNAEVVSASSVGLVVCWASSRDMPCLQVEKGKTDGRYDTSQHHNWCAFRNEVGVAVATVARSAAH